MKGLNLIGKLKTDVLCEVLGSGLFFHEKNTEGFTPLAQTFLAIAFAVMSILEDLAIIP